MHVTISQFVILTEVNSKYSNRFGNPYSEVFGVTDHGSEFRILKFRMADPIWRSSIRDFDYFTLICLEIVIREVLEVAEHKSKVGISKFIMADAMTFTTYTRMTMTH